MPGEGGRQHRVGAVASLPWHMTSFEKASTQKNAIANNRAVKNTIFGITSSVENEV